MKIALIGYGKMGKTIESLIDKEREKIVLRIRTSNLKDLNAQNITNADVAIEFSNPESAFENIKLCLENRIPVVSGTTGWLDQMDKIREICRDNCGAFFYASNFSLGMNIFMHMNKTLASLMNDHNQYEVSVEEIHHVHKLDAPSGTAITLTEDLIYALENKRSWVMGGESSSDNIVISSKREGEIPGTHIIKYKSTVDSIEIKHEAHSRNGFALGAILSARWLVNRRGCYGMNDLLKLNS